MQTVVNPNSKLLSENVVFIIESVYANSVTLEAELSVRYYDTFIQEYYEPVFHFKSVTPQFTIFRDSSIFSHRLQAEHEKYCKSLGTVTT